MAEHLTNEQLERALRTLIFSSMFFDEEKKATLKYGAYCMSIPLEQNRSYTMKWLCDEFFNRVVRTFKDE